MDNEALLSKKEKAEAIYYGFGGWLYFYLIVQLYSAYHLLQGFGDWISLIQSEDIKILRDNGYETEANLLLAIGLTAFIYAVLLLLLTLISWFFALRTSRFYKSINIIYAVFNVTGTAALAVLMVMINAGSTEAIYTPVVVYGSLVGAVIFAAMWIPYFIKSKRIANTFIR